MESILNSFNPFDPNFVEIRRNSPVRGCILPEWEDRIKYPCLIDGALQINVPQGLIKTIDDAATSPQWQLRLGRKSTQRLRLVKDIAALLFLLTTQRYETQDDDDTDSDSDSTSQQVSTDEGVQNPITITLPHSRGDSIDEHEMTTSRKRVYSVKTLKEDGYVRWSDYRIKPYYDDMDTVQQVIQTLAAIYVLPGHTTQHKIIDIRECGNRTYLRIDPFLLIQSRVPYRINRPKFIKAYRESVRYRWEVMQADPLLMQAYTNFSQLEKPGITDIQKHLEAMVGDSYKGKKIVSEAIQGKPKGLRERDQMAKQCIWIEDWIDLAKRYALDDRNPVYRSTFAKNRHYGPYSQMPAKVREMLRYKGKPLVWIDVSSCHKILMMSHYRSNKAIPPVAAIIDHIINAPIHMSDAERHPRSRFAAMAGIADDALLKDGINSWLNCKVWDMEHPAPECSEAESPWLTVTNAYHRIGLSDYVGFVIAWKRKHGYDSISRWLLREEAKIMDRALAICFSRGIYCLGVHDGIDCEEDRADEVRQIIMESFARYGYPCALKDTRG